jgi:LPS export ABC transporter permease LptF
VIIDRYIMREILKPTAAICLVLVVIYGSSMATRYWEDAVQGLLAGITVFQLILCRVLISLEVLLPTTFYLAVVIALGRFAASGELTAMSACGIGTARVTRAVALLACLVAATVAVLSLSVRPWAWTQFFLLKARAEARFDLTRMQGGNFYELGGGSRVLFADRVDTRIPSADKVFVLNRRDDVLQVIYAARAAQSRPDAVAGPAITLENGSLYEFPATGDGGVVLAFSAATMRLSHRRGRAPCLPGQGRGQPRPAQRWQPRGHGRAAVAPRRPAGEPPARPGRRAAQPLQPARGAARRPAGGHPAVRRLLQRECHRQEARCPGGDRRAARGVLGADPAAGLPGPAQLAAFCPRRRP